MLFDSNRIEEILANLPSEEEELRDKYTKLCNENSRLLHENRRLLKGVFLVIEEMVQDGYISDKEAKEIKAEYVQHLNSFEKYL